MTEQCYIDRCLLDYAMESTFCVFWYINAWISKMHFISIQEVLTCMSFITQNGVIISKQDDLLPNKMNITA